MIEAFVLIQTEIGKAAQVAAGARDIPGVTRAVVVTGPYDVMALIEASDMHTLGKLAITELKVDGVVRTVTCSVVHL